MCLFHKWSKWEQFTVELGTYIPSTNKTIKYIEHIEHRQRRHCKKCNYKQELKV